MESISQSWSRLNLPLGQRMLSILILEVSHDLFKTNNPRSCLNISPIVSLRSPLNPSKFDHLGIGASTTSWSSVPFSISCGLPPKLFLSIETKITRHYRGERPHSGLYGTRRCLHFSCTPVIFSGPSNNVSSSGSSNFKMTVQYIPALARKTDKPIFFRNVF